MGVTLSSRGYSSRSGSGGDNADEQGQPVGREVLFSRGGVKPPRLDQGQVLTTPMVAKVLVEFDSYRSKVRRESGDYFERRPALLLKVVDIVHKETLAFRYFLGAAHIATCHTYSARRRAA